MSKRQPSPLIVLNTLTLAYFHLFGVTEGAEPHTLRIKGLHGETKEIAQGLNENNPLLVVMHVLTCQYVKLSALRKDELGCYVFNVSDVSDPNNQEAKSTEETVYSYAEEREVPLIDAYQQTCKIPGALFNYGRIYDKKAVSSHETNPFAPLFLTDDSGQVASIVNPFSPPAFASTSDQLEPVTNPFTPH